jgi:aminoglycoside 6'-N-acetyltransferase
MPSGASNSSQNKTVARFGFMKMMRLAIERCLADPKVTAISIDPLASNRRAHRFYERLGFKFVEPRRFGLNDSFVFRLERADAT